MSKLNRRKEIKEKEEFRAKFELAMNMNSYMALKWLNTDKIDSLDSQASNDSFFQLPIIANGASLSNLTLTKSSKSIGDFVNGTDIKPDFKSQSKVKQSKPMTALMNKMRSQNRSKIEKNDIKAKKDKNFIKKPVIKQPEADSDLDNENINSRSVKKGHTLIFDKKKKARPF
jgi:preprotein translocase subunit SecD